MGEHSTWFDLIPPFAKLGHDARASLGRTWEFMMFKKQTAVDFSMVHVYTSALILLLLALAALRFKGAVSGDNKDRLIPDAKLSVRTVFELLTGMVLRLCEDVMGREKAERYLPLVGALFFFILFNNFIGLIPGFAPATTTLKTNLGIALLVFVMTHIYGIRKNGAAYLKHFLGPVLPLAPLMLPIELISNIARPVSLALRLMGNMFADHKVLATFFFLVPLVVPLPFYFLGIMVCFVQALVFTLLTIVYIDMAVADHGH